MATRIRRTSTAEAIVEHLLERIRGGEFGPGDRLPSERKLMGELGVGRLSLREGLARLSALGVIRVEHGKGAVVREGIDSGAIQQALVPLFPERDARALQDLVNARILIEGELAAGAALRRTRGDLRRLAELLDEPGEALDDDRALAELDYAFHRQIARIAGNAFLEVMQEALAEHIRSFLAHYAKAHGDKAGAVERHRPILDAIAAGDPEAARRAVGEHIAACKSSLEAYVEHHNGKAGRTPAQPAAL